MKKLIVITVYDKGQHAPQPEKSPAVITWRPDAPKPGTPDFDRWLEENSTKAQP